MASARKRPAASRKKAAPPRARPDLSKIIASKSAQLQWVPTPSVTRYTNNPRRNNLAVQGIVDSLKAFGWNQPIVVDEARVIIVGDTRYLAALHLGLEEVQVLVADWLSAAEVQAYRIADNKLAERSEWDWQRLEQEVQQLQAIDFDLAPIGFSASEIALIPDRAMEQAFSGLGGGAPAPPDIQPTPGSNDTVMLSVPMTVAHRDLVFVAILHAKKLFGETQSAPALARLCEQWREDHVVARV